MNPYLIPMLSLVGLLLISAMMFWWTLNRLMRQHETQMNSWILERERLMNRVMTKEWTSYTQMIPSPSLNSESEDVTAGMSDEEELRRWKLLHENPGIGEILNGDYGNEFNELGLFGTESRST